MSHRFIHIKQNTHLDIDIQFSIKEGITCIIGDSGAGKTTLLRAIAGLDKHRESIVAIESIWQDKHYFLATHKRKIAYTLQGDNLFSHLNVQKNLALLNVNESQYASLKSILKIDALLAKFPHELSGGETQRVALYKAFILDSEILLLDEPLSAIDSHHKKIILKEIQKIKQQINKPIIYVSHNYDEITQIADQIICIKKGKKEFDLPFSSNTLNRYFQKNEPQQISSLFDMKLDETNQDKGISQLKNDDFSIKTTASIIDPTLDYRVKILAKDISICTEKPKNTSILNIIEAIITEITRLDQKMLVAVTIGNSTVFSLISYYSFTQLNLTLNLNVWIQVKALNIN